MSGFKTKARKQTYTYEYSFDGNNWQTIPVTLNAAVLSDDYVTANIWLFSLAHLRVGRSGLFWMMKCSPIRFL